MVAGCLRMDREIVRWDIRLHREVQDWELEKLLELLGTYVQ